MKCRGSWGWTTGAEGTGWETGGGFCDSLFFLDSCSRFFFSAGEMNGGKGLNHDEEANFWMNSFPSISVTRSVLWTFSSVLIRVLD